MENKLSIIVKKSGNDYNLTNLTEEELNQCRELTKNIKDTDSLMSYGSDIAESRNEGARQILEMNKIGRADKIGEYVVEVVQAIKDSEYKEATGLKGIAYKMFPSLVRNVDKKILEKYNSSKEVVDRVMVALDAQQKELRADYNTIEFMLRNTGSYIEQLHTLIVALEVYKKDRQRDLDDLRNNNEDPNLIAQAQMFVDAIDKHSYDLQIVEHQHRNMTIPTLMKMKGNTEDLRRNAETIRKTVLPNWESSISMALINRRQEEALMIQKTIRDVNNKMIEENARKFKDTTIAIGKESQRATIDVETYKKAYSMTMEALKVSAENTIKAKEERAKNLAELERIDRENQEELKKIMGTWQSYYVEGSSPVMSKEIENNDL